MIDLKAWVKFDKVDDTLGTFTVSPLFPGMGTTIGNSLRRVLLSSLEGAAITSIAIEGVDHEFSAISNAVEDVLDVICNIKGIIFQLHSDEPVKLKISSKSKGVITAGDIEHDANVNILNKDHHIIELSKAGKFNMTMTLANGVGFLPSEANSSEDDDINAIVLDTSFSPIVRVNPIVEKVRVGKSLDYDSLTLDVLTDGSIDVEDAVKNASELLVHLFMLFADMNNKPVIHHEEEDPLKNQQDYALQLSVEDLELSARSINCLKKAGIDTVKTLVEKDMSELITIKNFGKKSADEINEKLAQYGLSLKDDENEMSEADKVVVEEA